MSRRMEGLARFVLTVLKLTLAFEFTAAVILTARWTGEFGLGQAAYYGLFHAVSAFNNAGFALFSDSLMRFRGDWIVNLVVTTLDHLRWPGIRRPHRNRARAAVPPLLDAHASRHHADDGVDRRHDSPHLVHRAEQSTHVGSRWASAKGSWRRTFRR